MSYPDVTETFTRDELAAPFHVPDPLAEPLPRQTRNPIVFEGDRWVEIDVETGEIVDEGLLLRPCEKLEITVSPQEATP